MANFFNVKDSFLLLSIILSFILCLYHSKSPFRIYVIPDNHSKMSKHTTENET